MTTTTTYILSIPTEQSKELEALARRMKWTLVKASDYQTWDRGFKPNKALEEIPQ